MAVNLIRNDASCFMQSDARQAIDVIKYGVITVTPHTRIYEAIACVVDLNISGLPVVDEQARLQGIITEKDLLILLYEKQNTSGLVETYMNRDVVSCTAETPLEEICRCLTHNSFRRVPIIRDGRVVSVISRTDLLRVNLHKFIAPEVNSHPFSTEIFHLARHVMRKKLITVRPDSSLSEAIAAMADYSLPGLPVIEKDRQLVGIITEKDVMPYFYSPQRAPEKVADLMTTELFTFGPEENAMKICECLIENSFRRVPITKNGVLIGLISRTDIIRFILRHIAEFSHFRAAQVVDHMICRA